MSEIIDFFKENIQEIAIIIVVVILLLVLINIKGVNLNEPKPDSKLVQEVTVETFVTEENIDNILNPANNFCDSYLGNSQELEGACNQLTETNCAQTPCCVYSKTGENGKCLAGDSNGPTYKTDKDGKLITMDTYYYLGLCHGTSCPT